MATKKKDKHERQHAEARASQAESGPPAKMKTKEYEREMRLLHGELVAHAGVGQGDRGQDLHRVRGTRHRRAREARSSGSPSG